MDTSNKYLLDTFELANSILVPLRRSIVKHVSDGFFFLISYAGCFCYLISFYLYLIYHLSLVLCYHIINSMYVCVVALLACVSAVAGHGVVLVPKSRSRIGKNMTTFIPDYDDDGLNCGGIGNRDYKYGRCGICGDPFGQPKPRAHELYGKFGEGVIAANYKPNSKIHIEVVLTAHHKGFWEFRLCDNPAPTDESCFKHLLKLQDGSTKYYPQIQPARNYYKVMYILPTDFTCKHCILQWKYTAGNNWGRCPNGTGALGCGIQEQFRACSDISITNSDVWVWSNDDNKDHKVSEFAWEENRSQTLMSGQPSPTDRKFKNTDKKSFTAYKPTRSKLAYENKGKKYNKKFITKHNGQYYNQIRKYN